MSRLESMMEESMSKFVPYLLPGVRAVLFVAVGMIFVLVTKLSYEEASRWWSIICIFVNLLTIIILLIVCAREGVTYKSLLMSRNDKLWVKYTLLIILLMMIIGIGSMNGFGLLIYGYIPVVMIQPIPLVFAFINIILLPLTVVFAEFPLYFGYSLNRIDKMTNNKWLAIGYPMFFYGIQHSFIPLIFQWDHMLFRFLSFIPLLIVVGLLYYRNRRLIPLMIGHGFLDFATAVQILIVSLFPTIFDLIN